MLANRSCLGESWVGFLFSFFSGGGDRCLVFLGWGGVYFLGLGFF